MQVIILAAGRGSRLKEIGKKTPKALVKVLNKPIIEYTFENIKDITNEVILVVGHLQNLIRKKYKNKYKNINIKYVVQKEQRGSGDALLCAKKYIKSQFLVLNGDDIFHKEDIKKLLRNKNSILAKKVEEPEKFGILKIDKEKYLKKIVEKPKKFISNLANIGAYHFQKEVFNYELKLSLRGEYEITDYVEYLAEQRKIKVEKISNYWFPVNSKEQILDAEKNLKKILDIPFKQRDIRGVYKKEIDEELFYKIGKLSNKILTTKKIVVGFDNRASSKSLSEAYIQGLKDCGKTIINLGQITTPILSKFTIKEKIFGAIITASHNPPEYNGIKFFNNKKTMISKEKGFDIIEKIILENKVSEKKQKGKEIKKDFSKIYCNEMKNKIEKLNKKIKVAIDCSNGASGPFVEKIIKNIKNLKVEKLFFKPDSSFPNHLSDTLHKENFIQLQKKVIEKKCDFGIMFDGDCDRGAIVDDCGKILTTDEFLCIAAKIESKNKKNPKVLFDAWFSKDAEKFLKNINCDFKKIPMGVNIHRKNLINSKGIFSIETSGHVFYKENECIDDGIFVFIKMLNYLNFTQEKLSNLRKDIITSKFKIRYYASNNSKKIIKKIEEKYKDKAKIEKIDGVTFNFKEWWFNVRPSLTEPILKMKIEAKTKELRNKKLKEIEKLIKEK